MTTRRRRERFAPGLDALVVPIRSLKRYPGNPRRGDAHAIAQSLERFGQMKPVVVQESTRYIVAGNHTTDGAEQAGWKRIAAVVAPLSDEEAEAYLVADNAIGDLAENDEAALSEILGRLAERGQLEGTGYTPDTYAELRARLAAVEGLPAGGTHEPIRIVPLADRFVAPPFSVLDARQGWWRERKREWLALGIRSELGRGDSRPHGQGANGAGGGPNDAWLTSKSGAHPAAGVQPLAPGVGMDPSNADGAVGQKLGAFGEPGRGKRDGSSLSSSRRALHGSGDADPRAYQRSEGQDSRGLVIENASGRDPRYYAQKQQVEATLGRELSTEEFDRDHYRAPGRGLLSEGSASHRDADFYRDKAAIEARLGREITREEYLAEHYIDDATGGGLTETGTSVFDPVLCELVYRWFCPEAGHVLDPYAGGSVRGLMAALLGRSYTGVDLSAPQLAANAEQVPVVLGAQTPRLVDDPDALTPVEQRGGYWLKRDDLFAVNGARGGKARTCLALSRGAPGLVTAGSRQSPQANIVAACAEHLGIPARVHTPTGRLGAELVHAQARGAEVVQHRPGYNTVLIARARADAEERGWREIPFGMEDAEAVEQTRRQVANLPACERLVVAVGSGMTLAGILWGLDDLSRDLAVLGVVVGADPEKRLDAHAPPGWRERCTLVRSPLDYHAEVRAELGGVVLDPVYEAKAVEHLEPGDCLWLVGIREQPPAGRVAPVWVEGDALDLPSLVDRPVDLVFTCPPYGDLERYSDDERDLSTMPLAEFQKAYRQVVTHSVSLLADDRFAVFVVGEYRLPDGTYAGLVPLTVAAFAEAGARLYNECILVTPVGSLPVRVGKQFAASRKLGKTHQNVLVFCKGDPRRAAGACGVVSVAMPETSREE